MGTIRKLFACRFQITIDIEGIVKMNLIFCHSKKRAKIAENAEIPNVGSISTHRKYFFWQKKFPLSFYTSKTIEKTLGHLILRTFAIFNPTYYLMCSMNTSSSTSSFPSLMSSMSCKSKKPKKCAKKKKEKKKNWGWQLSSWQMFFLGGGKCPNLGVVNVRILGVVNVLLANDSQSPC